MPLASNLQPDLADRADADDLYALGLWMIDQQAPDTALLFFEKTLEINPDFKEAIIRKNELIAGPARN
jgi:predicted lipid carrier protein YhbT